MAAIMLAKGPCLFRTRKERFMIASLSRFRWCWAVLAAVGLRLASATAAEAPLPRYKLQVGQELRYSGHSDFKYQSGKHINDTTWRIWVVRQNEDGGWRLVIRSGSVFSVGATPTGGQRDERVTFAWCDIS